MLAAVTSGCVFDWDALRYDPDAQADAPTERAPFDATADARPDREPPDARPDREAPDAAPDAPAMDVRDAADAALDAPAEMPLDAPRDAGIDAVEAARDAAPEAAPDVAPDIAPDIAPDLPPACTTAGMSCPCMASNPTGYCRPGEACTSGRCVPGTLAGSLVITEILNTPAMSSATTGEWFELYNPSATPYDLRGVRFSDNTTNVTVNRGTPVVIGPMSYAVIGRSDNLTTNGMVNVLYAYGTTSAVPALADDDRVVIDMGTAETEIDRVVYLAASWPNTRGRAKSLRPTALSATANDMPSNWCNAPMQWMPPGSDYGSPGAANPACP